MVVLIKEKLDKYLEFDSDELFDKKWVDFASIFGGAIRDIIAGDSDKINDIDIIGLPISLNNISKTLEYHNYKKMNLIKPDLHIIYKDIKFIFEPMTYLNSNQKIVQLIKPQNINNKNRSPSEFQLIRQNYYSLLTNVDLTSSGLFYDGEELYESMNFSYTHCKMKIYEKIPHAMMYNSTRTHQRSEKLKWDKNWKEYDNNLKLNRSIKINNLKRKNIKSIDDYIEKMKSFKVMDRNQQRPLRNE